MPRFFGTMYPHQIDAYAKAVAHIGDTADRGFCLWMDMGTGKTRVALRAIVDQANRGSRGALVVCPKAVIPSWISEAAATTDLKLEVLEGTKAQRVKALGRQADVYVTNYEGLRVMEAELLKVSHLYGGLRTLVFDESQRVSNRATAQSKVALKLADASGFVLLMSGTPVRNDARDLWHQVMLVDGGRRLGLNFWGFQNAHFVNVSRTRIPNWKPKSGSEDKIREATRDIVVAVKKDDVLAHLPPKIYHKRIVQMTPRQRDAYVEMAREMVVELRGEEQEGKLATANTVLVRYLRLQQIAQGFLYDEGREVVEEFEPNPKVSELLSILEDHAAESKNKAIVWVQFRHTIRQLMKLLADKGYNPVALYGDTSSDGIDKVFQEDPSVRVLIGQPRAGGLGVTLTQADLAVYFTNSWSHEDRRQSEDRCHRIGSEKVARVVNYVDVECQGTIDQHVRKALDRKAASSEMLVDFRRHLEQIADVREEAA